MRYLSWRWFAGAAALAAVASSAVAASLPCESGSDAPFVLGILAIVFGAVAAFLRAHRRTPFAVAAVTAVAAAMVLGFAEFYLVVGAFVLRCGD